MSHGCAYMRPGWDLEACCFWPFLEGASWDPPPQVAESEVLRPPGPPQQNPTCARGEHSPILPAGPCPPQQPSPHGEALPPFPPGS